ncbi:MAG: hypothetical protein M5U25_02040 [Planctomycetota bacterium]|nr:hypothetical protein [Planctomycetota bacterium]
MIGNANCKIAFVLQSANGTAGIDFWRLDNVLVADGSNDPYLLRSSGSNFDTSFTCAGTQGVGLANLDLTAYDNNDATIDITVSSSNPAPGVTAPASATGVTVPASLSWTGTPSAPGNYTYSVSLSDGINVTNETVTLSISGPVSSYPFVQGFESAPPTYFHTVFTTGAHTIPTVASAPPAPRAVWPRPAPAVTR